MTNIRHQSPFYRVLAALLDYPGSSFGEVLEEAERVLRFRPRPWPAFVTEALEAIAWMRDQTSLALQQAYVQTFDMTQQNSLHLTSHLLEEQDRRRGPALIKLAAHYRSAGFRLTDGELPDYLPAILEFASMLNEADAAQFLGEADDALIVLEDNLRSTGSPYVSLISAVRHAIQSKIPAMPAVATGGQS